MTAPKHESNPGDTLPATPQKQEPEVVLELTGNTAELSRIFGIPSARLGGGELLRDLHHAIVTSPQVTVTISIPFEVILARTMDKRNARILLRGWLDAVEAYLSKPGKSVQIDRRFVEKK